MYDALKRLLALRQELEALHRTTEQVLAESERLIVQFQASEEPLATRKFRTVAPSKPPAARRTRASVRRK
jgi:hypothetical protein